MLSCEHEKEPFGEPLCSHLRTCKEPWVKFVKWYVGSGLKLELICVPCAEAREKGLSTETAPVCQECFEYATTEVMDFERTGGQPEIRILQTTLTTTLEKTAIPAKLGKIVDIAPINIDSRSAWLMLSESGRIFRFDASSGESTDVASIKLPSEAATTPFAGHVLAPHLHASEHGEFASVVSDYGRYGQVIDLKTGKVTLKLDGGDYHPGTVPFSFAFLRWQGSVVVIHRTAWNRLDVSEASTGQSLSDRNPTSYRQGEERPQHYLDYFHGGLYLSPSGKHILDDGWVWHPVGIPVIWSIDCWLSVNAWESEDGPTRKEVCARSYYWDHGIAWLDDEKLAIGGIGDDDAEMIDGVRILTLHRPAVPGVNGAQTGCGVEKSQSLPGQQANSSARKADSILRERPVFQRGMSGLVLELATSQTSIQLITIGVRVNSSNSAMMPSFAGAWRNRSPPGEPIGLQA